MGRVSMRMTGMNATCAFRVPFLASHDFCKRKAVFSHVLWHIGNFCGGPPGCREGCGLVLATFLGLWTVSNHGASLTSEKPIFSPTKRLRQPKSCRLLGVDGSIFVEAFLKCWGSQQQIDVYNTGTLKASMKWHARPWLLGGRFCDLSKMEVNSDYADLSSKRSVSMTIEGRVSHFTIFIRGFTEGIDHLRVVTVQGMI